MAGAKRGKTTFCLQSAVKSKIEAGTRVLFVSLEVDETIMGDRLDASVSGTDLADLIDKRDDVATKVGQAALGAGKLWIERRPANSFSTNDLEILLEDYFNNGREIDMLVVDYLGIMRLFPSDDRFIGMGNATKELRRLAGIYDIAIVTPTQSNRDGFSKALMTASDIGESFAVVQDCDLLITINADQNELSAGVRRLYFAASRNQQEVTIKIQGSMSKMRMIEKVLDVMH
jgi:replicative DNA helicase